MRRDNEEIKEMDRLNRLERAVHLQDLEDAYAYELRSLSDGSKLATMITMVHFFQLAEELEQARELDDH